MTKSRITPNNRLYLKAANELKLPVNYNPMRHQVECKLGPHRYIFRNCITPFNDPASADCASNKFLMNKILRHAGFPVPQATVMLRESYLENKYDLSQLPYPVVAKPTKDTARGYGVICNIPDEIELEAYLKTAFLEHQIITIEKFCADYTHYRVLVLFNRVIGVVKRDAAQVTGDGIHTIEELIHLENIKRQHAYQHLTMNNLQIDQEYLIRLKELGLTPQSIPARNEVIRLCYNVNASRGGTMTGMRDQICPENAALFCGAARTLNLNIAGFDMVCKDINIPIATSSGYIIEANRYPDVTIHENPLYGDPYPVTKIILKTLIAKHPIYYLKHRLQRLLSPLILNYRAMAIILAILSISYFMK